MTLEDWAECPCCQLPCSAAAMRAVLAAEGACPMCGERVAPDAVARLARGQAEARLRAAATGAAGSVPAAGAAAAAGLAGSGGGSCGAGSGAQAPAMLAGLAPGV
jgi:hypothetical protein